MGCETFTGEACWDDAEGTCSKYCDFLGKVGGYGQIPNSYCGFFNVWLHKAEKSGRADRCQLCIEKQGLMAGKGTSE